MKKSKNWQKCMNKKCTHYDKTGEYLNRCEEHCQDREGDCNDAVLKDVTKKDRDRVGNL